MSSGDGRVAAELEASLGVMNLARTDPALPAFSPTDKLFAEELAERLTRAARMPVLFSSGYTTAAISDVETGGGHVAFIERPFGPAELLTAVQDAVDAGG